MLEPRAKRDELSFGAAYHGKMEGLPDERIDPEFVASATALATKRQRGAPMGEALAKEEPRGIEKGKLSGIYTCRFDRREPTTVREYKTAGRLYDNDREQWDINGEIIGQLLALEEMGVMAKPKVTVDIITKERLPATRQIEVALTETKRAEFESMISDSAREIRQRLDAYEGGVNTVNATHIAAFPVNTESCVRYGKLCQFYAYCWTSDRREKLNYVENPMNARWRDYLINGKGLSPSQTRGATHGKGASDSKAKPGRAGRERRSTRR